MRMNEYSSISSCRPSLQEWLPPQLGSRHQSWHLCWARCHVLLLERLGLVGQACPLQKLCLIDHRFEGRHRQVCLLSIVHPLQKPGISDDVETRVMARLPSNVDIGNGG